MKFLFSVVLSLLASMTFAHELTPQEALSNAIQKLNSGMAATKGGNTQSSIVLSYTENGTAGTPLFYVYKKGDGGFIIAGADSRSNGLLGYTDNGDFATAKKNPAFQSWLANCTAALQWLSNQPEKTVTSSKPTVTELTTSVVPLLGDIKWNQGTPYNNQCPKLSSGDNSATGCAATATAQVMMYYQWPKTGEGTHTNSINESSIVLETPGAITVDFTQSTYDWEHMKTTYTGTEDATDASAIAVAKLMADVGCAMDMEYGEESSAVDKDIFYAMTTHFKYDKTMRLGYRKYYTSDNWNSTLRAELDSLRPIIMCAYTSQGGHCFVIDGYDTNGYYHVNWGWGGASDGYFDINYMNPNEQGIGGNAGSCYNMGQTIIYNIKKDEGGTASPDLKITNQISYSPSEEYPFSYSFVNNGTGNFTGIAGFALLDSKGNLLEEIPFDAKVEGFGTTCTIYKSIPSTITLNEGYFLVPYYKMTSSDEISMFDNPLTARPLLIYRYNSENMMWYWANGWKTSSKPAQLTCTKCEVKRNYIGYAPKFSVTVSNSSKSKLEYNAPIYIFISKTTGTDKDATTTSYCYGATQLFLEPGDSKTIDVECNVASDTMNYDKMTEGEYTYEVCNNVCNSLYYLRDSNSDNVMGTINMESAAASNITYSDFKIEKTSLAKGENLTASFIATNTGGFAMESYVLFIFNEKGGTSVDYIINSVEVLGNGTSNNISLSKTLSLEPGNYIGMFYIYNSSTHKSTKISPQKTRYPFTVTGATAINEITTSIPTQGETYDLTGRRVLNMKKGGLYIINGKKVIY